MQRHRKEQQIQARWLTRNGAVPVDGFMFTNDDGNPYDPDAFSVHFNRVVKRAGLRKMRLRDLRHAHASHLIAIGKSPLFVQQRLGHAKVTTTLELYGHLWSGMEASDMEEAAERIYGTGGTG